MSLLLDALRTAEPEAGTATEPEEEPLDAHATLKILAPKPAQGPLSLVPTPELPAPPSMEFAPGLGYVDAAVPPAPESAALKVAEPANAAVALAVGSPAQVSFAPNARAAVGGAPNTRVSPQTPGSARTANAPAQPMPRFKKYALLLSALAAIAGIGLAGKLFWPFGSSGVMYPERRPPQEPPASADPAPAAAPTTDAVHVPSERPADQFAYAGNAPEIALGGAEVRVDSSAAVTVASRADPAPGSDARAASVASHRATALVPRPRSASVLSVTRAEGSSSIDRHVDAGYRALAAGNFTTAQDEYAAALELDPNNVDALLGTAAVAVRTGRAKAAALSYLGVLKLEPGNPDATAAMAMLGSEGVGGDANESRLKILIASDDGGRSALHAALGGVYAADVRWPEAAQEYFVALAKDPGNPDLAFDVAASLDQNRNSAAALSYYRQALSFARQRPTQLDTHAIERRITQLQTHEGRAQRAPDP